MSLLVWLPLNGDIHNLGLKNILFNSIGITTDNNGKIGKCYSFDGNTSRIYSNLSIGNEWSAGCWFYASNASKAWISLILLNNNSGDSDTLIGLYCNPSTGKLSSIANGVSHVNTYACTGLWIHYMTTFKNLILSTYINGTLLATKTITNAALSKTNLTIGARSTNAAGAGTSVGSLFEGKINDVRIYDHCLSPKEVEEISKGLVLHYKLDDEYIESTTNLITTEDGLSNTCYNGATSKYGYGSNTDMYKTVGIFLGKKGTKVYMGTAGQNAYPYVYFDPFNTTEENILTLSFDYYPTSLATIIPYSYNGNYNFSYTTNGVAGSATNVTSVIIPVNTNQWNHITITMQKYDTTNTSRGNGYIRIGSAKHISTTTDYWVFANILVENKDHATGYAGVGGTRNSNIIYDCSGYGNNGTIINSLTINNDTARYNLSLLFNGSNTAIAAGRGAMVKDEISVCCWALMNTWSSYNGRLLSCTEGGGWNFEPSSGKMNFACGTGTSSNAYKSAVSATTLTNLGNKWHFFVGTYNGLLTKIYIDGILENTNNAYSTKTPLYYHTSNGIFIGAEAASSVTTPTGSYFNGKISDVRIYATALTADLIKELYNVSATIDNKGNGYAREEIEDSNLNITKTGQFHNGELLDSNDYTTASITKTDRLLKVNNFYEY